MAVSEKKTALSFSPNNSSIDYFKTSLQHAVLLGLRNTSRPLLIFKKRPASQHLS